MTMTAWLLLLASPAAAQMPAFELPINPLRAARDGGAVAPEPVFTRTVPFPVEAYDRSKFSAASRRAQAQARDAWLKDNDDPRVVRFTIPKTKAYFEKVLERLIAGSGLEKAMQAAPLALRVNDSSWGSPSASMSSGVLRVDPEVAAIMDSEDEVAAVIAHELVHHLRAHHEQLLQTVKKHPRTGGGDMFSAPVPSKQELEARWYHECEADALSLRLLANAGYDPSAAADALRKVKAEVESDPIHGARAGRGDPTHPSLEVRTEYIARVIAAEKLPSAARTRGGLDEVHAECAARTRGGPGDEPASEIYRHYKTVKKP
ncbi:MAG: DUF45 domain-containing protein [Elusimicrobiota bacterium]|nr:MAG: DUF45 domain-containing protein [Elusimicrobiota bacterium]